MGRAGEEARDRLIEHSVWTSEEMASTNSQLYPVHVLVSIVMTVSRISIVDLPSFAPRVSPHCVHLHGCSISIAHAHIIHKGKIS